MTYYKKMGSDSEGLSEEMKLINDLNAHTEEEETKERKNCEQNIDLRAELIKLEQILPKQSEQIRQFLDTMYEDFSSLLLSYDMTQRSVLLSFEFYILSGRFNI